MSKRDTGITLEHKAAAKLDAPVSASIPMPVGGAGAASPGAMRAAVLRATSWPRSFWIAAALLAVLYAPVLLDAFKLWTTDDNYSYCIFIIPICLYLAWKKLAEPSMLAPDPSSIGVYVLLLGLLMEFAGQQMGIAPIAMWSLVPVLSGVILLLHGKSLLSRLRFPIGYLLFAGSLPSFVFGQLNGAIQHISTLVSAKLMEFLGFTVANVGNQIDVPGLSVEVADVCGGYRKMVVLVAFVILFAHLARKSRVETIVLLVLAVPIAIIANSVRICSLISVADLLGLKAFDVVHAPADFTVLIAAFFVLFQLIQFVKWPKPTS